MGYVWYFSKDGKPAFFVDGQYVFSPDVTYSYFIRDGWWFTPAGEPAYFVDGQWVHTKEGTPAFYTTIAPQLREGYGSITL